MLISLSFLQSPKKVESSHSRKLISRKKSLNSQKFLLAKLRKKSGKKIHENYFPKAVLKGVVPRILSIIKNTKFLFYNLNLV